MGRTIQQQTIQVFSKAFACFWIILVLSFNTFELKAQLSISPEQLLREYVQIESITGHERPAGEFLAQKCTEAGLDVHIFSNLENSFNFAASLYPLEQQKPNIVFLNHCDVVDVGDISKWTYPPFSGTIAERAVWGRGAIDNKALAVMQLMSLQKFVEDSKTKEFPYNITILTVSNEEKGGHLGAEMIAQEHLDLLNPCVVFGEGGIGTNNILPSDPERVVFGISIASKQAMWMELSLQNESNGHGSSSPCKNVNNQLIMGLSRVVDRQQKLKLTPPVRAMLFALSSYGKGLVRFGLRHPKLIMPFAKKKILDHNVLSLLFKKSCYNITRIYSSAGSNNSMPNEVNAVLDCRFAVPMKSDKVIRRIERKFDNPNLNVSLLNESPSAKQTKPDGFFDFMKQAVLSTQAHAAVVPILFPATVDNNYFRNQGIPVYGFVPCELAAADVARIHNIDERIPIDCLYQGIEIFQTFIELILREEKEPSMNQLAKNAINF